MKAQAFWFHAERLSACLSGVQLQAVTGQDT